jgi:hypothetical protein
MLNEFNHWMEIAGTAVDAILLIRVLALRLHRIYLFITLACVVGLISDIANLWFGGDEQVGFRLFLYTRFLYVIVFPLVSWDVFEEMKTQVTKLRKIAIVRLISGLIVTAIFGLIMTAMLDTTNSTPGEPPVLITLGLLLWAGAASASLIFLRNIDRVLRLQRSERPHNTNVWMYFYELSFLGEILSCLILLLASLLKTNAGLVTNILGLVLMTYGILITAWCVLRLRAAPTDVASASENASL